VGGFPNYGDLALLTVATKKLADLDPNGCFPTMSPDNNYNILYTDNGATSHQQLYMIDKDQHQVMAKNLWTGTVKVFKSSNERFESLRYTSDAGFVALFSSPYSDASAYTAAGSSNPKIIRLSDLAWAAVNDNCETPEGNADVWFYSDAGVRGQAVAGSIAGPADQARSTVAFSVDGRRMGGSAGDRATRLAIRRIGPARTTAVVLAP
jgi:hypothetical protein